ncbi:OLC1v1010469C1 [Oldenlandia corymbosa var. corymbosa]|uniref:MLO-like protein n=1 Tax=Oldenlandia corymbosa var. corymbosa TaxID=529605 RepID=A0AAV1DTW6_OLDCO|nr:OLC1v1010469C1 [Oldenlandia corymbosa var. corymbosa]
MAAGDTGERSLKETPTWAVAVVCAVFVIISIIIEHGIHKLGHWFQKRQKKAMSEALEKIKSELMLLGFVSLLITFGQQYVVKICIPSKAGNTMLPCKKPDDKGKGAGKGDKGNGGGDGRKLLWYIGEAAARRVLAAGGGTDHCSSKHKDMVPLITQSGIHQLHIFIFVLAVFHVIYSVLTIVLAKAKMRKWAAWEEETTSLQYQFTTDPSRFRFVHQTSFVRQYSGYSTKPGIRWIVAFFRQFFLSVTKADYMTMRHGFINAHFAPDSKFNFHKYIKRSMEDDFKEVLGISIPLWTFAIIFQLLNVYRWYFLVAISFLPPLILLIVGAKLEIIIMDMAQQIQDKTTVVRGAPVVEPSNKYFWFNRPRLILGLIHFTLFQNAFQMAYFLWIWYEFGLSSCFHERLSIIVSKVVLGVAFQVLCSYITFPLYALVTQMGTHMKRSIFEEQTAKALMKWQKAAKQRRKQRKAEESQSGYTSGDTQSSPQPLLHKYKTNPDIENSWSYPTSPRAYHSETDYSDFEEPTFSSRDDQSSRRNKGQNQEIAIAETVQKANQNSDFSFSRS